MKLWRVRSTENRSYNTDLPWIVVKLVKRNLLNRRLPVWCDNQYAACWSENFAKRLARLLNKEKP
jgi:hypothetical protein